MKSRDLLSAVFTAMIFGAPLVAAPITVSGYDINDAVLSGHGTSWSHTFTGTITPGVVFDNNTFAGTTATYSGVGNGTLTDGVISSSTSGTQLFVGRPGATDGTLIDPTLFFTLPVAHIVDIIELFGGDITNNGIPGNLTGVTVTLLKTDFTTVSETFATTPFGPTTSSIGTPVNDRVTLTGSTLENVPAFAVFLSEITGPASSPNTHSNIGGWFSLTEVTFDGSLAPTANPIPEPGSIALLGIGLTGLGVWRRRSGRRKAVA